MWCRHHPLEPSANDDEGTVVIATQPETVVLLSGGIDSATALALALEQEATPGCLFIDYGQAPALAEAEASARVAAYFDVPHRAITCRGLRFRSGEIRGRNAFLLHVALIAFTGDSGHVSLGIHAGTPYRDCGPDFVETMRASYDFHTGGRIGIAAPFIDSFKGEVFALAADLSVPIDLTYSCEASDTPCRTCLSCRDRESLLASS